MFNQVGIMGRLKEKPYILTGMNNENIYCMKLEVEKNINFDIEQHQYDEIDFVLWQGKYSQIESDDFYLDKCVMVKGRLENVRYKENNHENSKLMICVEDIDFLSKYCL